MNAIRNEMPLRKNFDFESSVGLFLLFTLHSVCNLYAPVYHRFVYWHQVVSVLVTCSPSVSGVKAYSEVSQVQLGADIRWAAPAGAGPTQPHWDEELYLLS